MRRHDEFAGQYVTEAVESTVYDRGGDVVGHVGLLDADDVALGEAVDAADRLPGPVAVLRSSEQSYHLWGLAVLPFDDWLDLADDVGVVDVEHSALSESRECSVLRLDDKIGVETGETVKPAPVFREWVDDAWTGRVSRPHARIIDDDLAVDVEPVDDPARGWSGHSTDRRVYMADVGGRGGGDR